MNFIKAFQNVIFSKMNTEAMPPLKIIADNCERKTIKMLLDTGLPTTVTNFGNAGSLKKTFELALDESSDDDILYFCEDDYLHLGTAPQVIHEGVTIADYVTLYDHPDKYTAIYAGGEVSKVMRTPCCHWRFTQSTCMTFGCKAKTLREDKEVWDTWLKDAHPHDHHVFSELTKHRKLGLSIPGVACHTDLSFSGAMNYIFIDNWAIDLMCEEIQQELETHFLGKFKETDLYQNFVEKRVGWGRLIALDAILNDKRKTN